MHAGAAARAWAPHFGQTIKPAGVANLDGRGTLSIPRSLSVVSHFGHCPVNLNGHASNTSGKLKPYRVEPNGREFPVAVAIGLQVSSFVLQFFSAPDDPHLMCAGGNEAGQELGEKEEDHPAIRVRSSHPWPSAYRQRYPNSWPCNLPKWRKDLDSRSHLTFQKRCHSDISGERT